MNSFTTKYVLAVIAFAVVILLAGPVLNTALSHWNAASTTFAQRLDYASTLASQR